MSANLRAFLFLIRWAEGTSGENGYRTLVGGKLFDSFEDHPRKIQTIRFGQQEIHSSAAGAYQFLVTTWDRAAKALNLPDFSPESQDKAAIWLIQQRGALSSVESGDLHEALTRCSWEWASLPPSRYNQPVKTYDACAVIFERAGGTITQPGGATPQGTSSPPDSSPVPAPAAPSVKEKIMAAPALIVAAAQALLPFIADLMRERGSKTATRNADILEKAPELVPVIMELGRTVVPDAKNEQEVVERITADKTLQAQLRAEAAMRWSDIKPFLEFEAEERNRAREFAERLTSTDNWRAVGYGLILMTLILIVVLGGGALLWNMAFHSTTDSQTKGMIVGAVIAAVTMILQFFFGSSRSSQLKDQTIAEQAKK